jgi:hypothetical protein
MSNRIPLRPRLTFYFTEWYDRARDSVTTSNTIATLLSVRRDR